MRHNMNKLRDQETFNLGQIHLVLRVIYQRVNRLPSYGRGRLLELIYVPSRTLTSLQIDLPGANTAPGQLTAFSAPD